MFLIRGDGNAKIGAGHLMRCFTIADALPDREEVRFLCADRQSSELARSRGYQAITIGTDYRVMEQELSWWEETFGQGASCLPDTTLPDRSERLDLSRDSGHQHVILVDSYFVTDYYLSRISAYGVVMLLDDMAQKAYPVDIVFNINVFARQETYEVLYNGKNTRYYAGSCFVPVRPEFRNTGYQITDQVENILITTGGGDCDNIAGRILDRIYDEAFHFHVISGRFNPGLDALKKRERESRNIFIHHDVKDMAGMMKNCQLGITAGGTTVYELSSIGVPFVCFSYAENQEALTEYIGSNKIAGYGGAYHKDQEKTLGQIQQQCLELTGSRDKRNEYYVKETKLIDGCGAERVAGILLFQSEELWRKENGSCQGLK